MDTFKYWGKDLDGVSYTETIEAKEAPEFIKNIREKGIYVYKVKKIIYINLFNKISTNLLMVFCKQFSSMLKTGMPLWECLDIISLQTDNKIIKNEIKIISSRCQNGLEISYCMKNYCKVFPKVMIDMIQVGEECGMLEKVLEDLYLYYKRSMELKNKLIAALSYPLTVLSLSFCLITFLILNVIPSFVSTLNSTGGDIPLITRYILNLSVFIKKNCSEILCITALTVLFCIFFYKSKKGKKIIDKLKFHLPVISKIYKNFITDKFSRIMAMLIGSGLPIIKSFIITRNVFKNAIVKEVIDNCIQSLESGGSLHETINDKKIFQPILYSMITIGEESGTLDEMFQKTSEFLDDDIYRQLNIIIRFVEPLLLVFISLIVGLLILAVVLPVININNSI